jgi:predicted PhzF superfamily epimerase YddE/YHI9
MARLSYRIVNVFTQQGDRFSGNRLCVFEDGSALDTQAMQALALQFNLSETMVDDRRRIFVSGEVIELGRGTIEL